MTRVQSKFKKNNTVDPQLASRTKDTWPKRSATTWREWVALPTAAETSNRKGQKVRKRQQTSYPRLEEVSHLKDNPQT